MSPEQAEGRLDQVGPLSDVYSLGATLYCLLTGKPPLGETDVGEALRRVQRGEFPPPRAVRPSIPPGLEAICLKAMALKPEERYPSAPALADDLEHWLADEPVSVHREPISVRLTRWGRRHRTLATSIGVLLIATVVGLAIATALIRGEQLRTEGERLRAELSLTETKRQRTIAEQNALDATRRAEELRRKNYIGSVNLALSECLGNNVIKKKLGVDYVMEVTLSGIQIYQPRSNNQIYEGRADVDVSVYDVDKGKVAPLHNYIHAYTYPKGMVRSVDSIPNVSQFKQCTWTTSPSNCC